MFWSAENDIDMKGIRIWNMIWAKKKKTEKKIEYLRIGFDTVMQGQLTETLDISSLWKLMAFVCLNLERHVLCSDCNLRWEH